MESKKFDFEDEIVKQFQDSVSVKEDTVEKCLSSINEVVNIVINAYKNNKKVLWCGNGGSAADAQHLACELVSKFYMDRKPLRSIALTTNTSILTAVSNDYDYNKVFARQVEALAEKGDVLIGITTSGTSKNILEAFESARKKGVITIALTGQDINEIKKLSDHLISIPSNETARIQESHILIGHIICYLLEKTLFGEK